LFEASAELIERSEKEEIAKRTRGGTTVGRSRSKSVVLLIIKCCAATMREEEHKKRLLEAQGKGKQKYR
jgi:hypothetical protein